jgi:hypothetical protein
MLILAHPILVTLMMDALRSSETQFLQDPHGVISLRTAFFTANVVPSALIHFTLMMDTISSSKTSVPAKATRHHISEDGIIHSHNSENLAS